MSLKVPVKHPVKFYSYTDIGAPSLQNVDGSVKNILKACLIDGYGDKEGAGWELLFDDTYSMVVNMPYATSEKPILRIDNGTCNGVVSNSIKSYRTVTSHYGDTPITSFNILTRYAKTDGHWYLIVTDLGFIFCHSGAENNYDSAGRKQNLLYVGGVMNIMDNTGIVYIGNTCDEITSNGVGGTWLSNILYTSGRTTIHNLMSGSTSSGSSSAINFTSISKDELYYNNEYLAQKVFFHFDTILPFYKSVCISYETTTVIPHNVISMGGRPFLRYVNRTYQPYGDGIYYIPLDYLEI